MTEARHTRRTRVARQRNPRGHGDRLRTEIIDAATAILAESPDPSRLSLRSVAKRAGIAATSIYPHFPDIENLTAAVAERQFAELGKAIGRAYRTTDDPVLALIAGSQAYCRFALRHTGAYRTLFEVARPDLAASASYSLEQSSGRRVLDALASAIARCQQQTDAPEHGVDPHFLAVLLWAGLHGIVSLRLSRARFPWPPVHRLVEEIVRRVVAPA